MDGRRKRIRVTENLIMRGDSFIFKSWQFLSCKPQKEMKSNRDQIGCLDIIISIEDKSSNLKPWPYEEEWGGVR